MGLHPCCGNSLQRGTKAVAIYEIVGSCITLLIFGFFVLFFGAVFIAAAHEIQKDKQGNMTSGENGGDMGTATESTNGEKDDQLAVVVGSGIFLIVIFVFVAVGCIISILLAVMLLKGANERHETKCKIWLVVRCILCALALIGLFGPASGAYKIMTVLQLVLQGYFIWIVYAFIQEIKAESQGVGWNSAGGVKV